MAKVLRLEEMSTTLFLMTIFLKVESCVPHTQMIFFLPNNSTHSLILLLPVD